MLQSWPFQISDERCPQSTHFQAVCVCLKRNQGLGSWSKISLIQEIGLNGKIVFTWIFSKGFQILEPVPQIGPEVSFTLGGHGPSPGQAQGTTLVHPHLLSSRRAQRTALPGWGWR